MYIISVYDGKIMYICISKFFCSMAKRNIIKRPGIFSKGNGGDFWKQIGMIVIGTTLSLVFTLVAAKLTENSQRAKDRRMSAMMVISNIEGFAQKLDYMYEVMARTDTVSAWLLNHPIDEFEMLPEPAQGALLSEALGLQFLTYDKTAESIFSNNIETWRNMGNYQFIYNVGECFSMMRTIEDYWNEKVEAMDKATEEVQNNTEQYPGNQYSKLLRSRKVLNVLYNMHNLRCWLKYNADMLHYMNRQNMAVIGISEKKMLQFIEERQQEIVVDIEEPNPNFYTPPLSLDSLTTLQPLSAYLDSIRPRN